MENIGIALGITGGILGISAFFGEWIIALFKYLYVDISIVKAEMSKIKYSARLTLENRGPLRKKVEYAALIISPENESTDSTIRQIAEAIKKPELLKININQLRSKLTEPQYLDDGQRAIIPLPFIFSDQRYVAERTACSYVLDTSKLTKNNTYSIKLYILHKFLFTVRKSAVQELLFID